MARPFKEDKKQSLHIKLPPYLIEWMNRQPESRAVLIETALNFHYQIPESLKPVSQTPKTATKKSRKKTTIIPSQPTNRD